MALIFFYRKAAGKLKASAENYKPCGLRVLL
jgi:hypothetical protein